MAKSSSLLLGEAEVWEADSEDLPFFFFPLKGKGKLIKIKNVLFVAPSSRIHLQCCPR